MPHSFAASLMTAQPVVTIPASRQQALMDIVNFGVSIRLAAGSTGTLAGSFALQFTDFGDSTGLRQPQASDWVTNPSTVVTWTGTPIVYSVQAQGNRWLRVLFTNAGSTGAPTVDAAITCKTST